MFQITLLTCPTLISTSQFNFRMTSRVTAEKEPRKYKPYVPRVLRTSATTLTNDTDRLSLLKRQRKKYEQMRDESAWLVAHGYDEYESHAKTFGNAALHLKKEASVVASRLVLENSEHREPRNVTPLRPAEPRPSRLPPAPMCRPSRLPPAPMCRPIEHYFRPMVAKEPVAPTVTRALTTEPKVECG